MPNTSSLLKEFADFQESYDRLNPVDWIATNFKFIHSELGSAGVGIVKNALSGVIHYEQAKFELAALTLEKYPHRFNNFHLVKSSKKVIHKKDEETGEDKIIVINNAINRLEVQCYDSRGNSLLFRNKKDELRVAASGFQLLQQARGYAARHLVNFGDGESFAIIEGQYEENISRLDAFRICNPRKVPGFNHTTKFDGGKKNLMRVKSAQRSFKS